MSLICVLAHASFGNGQTTPIATPIVVTDIKPLHGLTSALMRGMGTPTYLVPDGASPHDHALRPSDARTLRRADLILWMGPELSPFLTKPLANQPKINLNLAQTQGIGALPLRTAGLIEGSSPEGQDPHIWFNPLNALHMAKAIASRLSAAAPESQQIIQTNLALLQAGLKQLDASLAQTLKATKATPFVLTHDSIQYFTHRYGLPVTAILTNGPEHPRSLSLSRKVRQVLLTHPNTCVVGEPPFARSSNDTLIRGTEAASAFIDPIGADIPAGPNHYQLTLRKLAKDLSGCSPR